MPPNRLAIRLETPRLILVPLTEDRIDAVTQLHADPVVEAALFSDFEREPNYEAIRMDRRQTLWRARGIGQFAILDRQTEAFVGYTGAFVRAETGALEIGWTLSSQAHGKGLASEATAAAIHFTLQSPSVARLTCAIRKDNAPSIRVAQKLGFRFWRKQMIHGRYLDIYVLDQAAFIRAWPQHPQQTETRPRLRARPAPPAG